MRPSIDGRWLDVDLGCTHDVLSWAIIGGGYTSARRVSWREVTDSDLPLERDPAQWIVEEMSRRAIFSDVVLLTSRKIATWEHSGTSVQGGEAEVVATVGLGNGVCVGQVEPELVRRTPSQARTWGTINVLCRLDSPLSLAAMIEALSIATEARTRALLNRQISLGGEPISGTGTDCIVIAAPRADTGHAHFAGKHTALGRSIGSSVYQAVGNGADRWLRDRSERMKKAARK